LNQQKKTEKQFGPAKLIHLSKKQMIGVKPEVKNDLSKFLGLNAIEEHGAPARRDSLQCSPKLLATRWKVRQTRIVSER
jgi:hypothetical protein